jgi:hypothetical protein
MRKSITGKGSVSRKVIALETLGFLIIIATIWADQVFDIPYYFLGAMATPVNWRESLFESIIIVLIGSSIVYHTSQLFNRMRHLEGMLPVCASCKKIRIANNEWQQIETYIRDKSEAEFSHSICPECAKQLYPEFYSEDKEGPA